jgi:hypothetical protein
MHVCIQAEMSLMFTVICLYSVCPLCIVEIYGTKYDMLYMPLITGVTTRAAYSNIQNLFVFPHSVFVCSVWFSQ